MYIDPAYALPQKLLPIFRVHADHMTESLDHINDTVAYMRQASLTLLELLQRHFQIGQEEFDSMMNQSWVTLDQIIENEKNES